MGTDAAGGGAAEAGLGGGAIVPWGAGDRDGAAAALPGGGGATEPRPSGAGDARTGSSSAGDGAAATWEAVHGGIHYGGHRGGGGHRGRGRRGHYYEPGPRWVSPQVPLGSYWVTRPWPTRIRAKIYSAPPAVGTGHVIRSLEPGTRIGPVLSYEVTDTFVTIQIAEGWINVWCANGGTYYCLFDRLANTGPYLPSPYPSSSTSPYPRSSTMATK